MSKYLKVAIEAAQASGKVLSKCFNTGIKAIHKKGTQYVTLADYESQDVIKKIIKEYYPAHNIFSEEAEYEDNKSNYTWYIDPLDGTHNYIRNLPIFGVSIALTHKDNVVVGVTHFPMFKKIYYTENGKGAFMNGKRIHVSKFKPEDSYTLLLELKNEARDISSKFLKVIKDEKNKTRAFGCSSYSLSLLAEGNVEAFVTFDTNLYDVGAGIILVEEAGGRVTDIHGKKWKTTTKDFVFSNRLLHNRILSSIKKAGL